MNRVRTLVLVVVLAVIAACGSGSVSNPAADRARPLSGVVTVSAASSLSSAFDRIARDFESTFPGTSVTVNLGPSSTLATQIEQGAPADVFAAADEATMRGLVDGGFALGRPRVFVRNAMVIVTKPGNPERVRTLGDLPNVGFVALCGVEVPCGKYAAQVLAGASVEIPEDRVTRQIDAKATIGAVANGDADAAVVYATDARAAGAQVAKVAIPAASNVIATYPIVTVRSNANPPLARAFVSYVIAPGGQATLRSFGFLRP